MKIKPPSTGMAFFFGAIVTFVLSTRCRVMTLEDRVDALEAQAQEEKP